jgi:septum formation protein
VTFTTDPADLDEDAIASHIENPEERALTLATAKAIAISAKHKDTFVLGGDQVCYCNYGPRRYFDKPKDDEDHRRMLTAMSGRVHEFHSAVALVYNGSVIQTGGATAGVLFRKLSDSVISSYLACNEGKLCCGGYEIENRGSQLVEVIFGGLHYAILGLPLLQTLDILRNHCPIESGLLL